MKNFQQKRGFRNVLHSRPVLAFLGIFVLIFIWGVINFMGKMEITRENRKIAENKVAELEKQKKEFSTEITSLKTVDGIEENIREKFPVAKDGEGMIVIVDYKKTAETQKKEFLTGFSSLFFWKNWFK